MITHVNQRAYAQKIKDGLLVRKTRKDRGLNRRNWDLFERVYKVEGFFCDIQNNRGLLAKRQRKVSVDRYVDG
jgi:hypothetical protein